MFRAGDELLAHACTAIFLGNDEAADFAVGFGLEMMNDADVDPPYCCLIDAGYEDEVIGTILQGGDAVPHGFEGIGVAEFGAELGSGRSVREGDRADDQSPAQRSARLMRNPSNGPSPNNSVRPRSSSIAWPWR